jgi:hypothetical protein
MEFLLLILLHQKILMFERFNLYALGNRTLTNPAMNAAAMLSNFMPTRAIN